MEKMQFVREACRIQHATKPRDIAAMAEVFDVACGMSPVEIVDSVVALGGILDPTVTALRRSPAVFANFREAAAPQHIKRKLDQLREFVAVVATREDALEAYWAFEEIHPLPDGNGRVGMVLYNVMLGTTHSPEIPPDREVW